ncbi:hypothetical protein Arub01_26240 [Actinomadura rubrobrunea]|uniref:non-specific serine/threonine protein kinase n=1 Tax=Actinomadura rubrobrunea TaxID=115335 RepID=A0A9W6PV44_9ACTN|nr:serine/threonine-protein kinase [Actinomadura rubrobrunea]GLW64380.1 hypothetical protein Arub01_26240 [Actinomadura rubrobrunea]
MSGAWRIAGFEELRELGAGAQGRVVLARHQESGTPVAIKYVRADAEQKKLLRREAVLLGRVDDPHVARLYRLVESEYGAALVMEAIDGVSLKQVLEHHGTLEPEAALLVMKGSLLGLAAAHRVGVVHRDYKPSNVVVRSDGLSKLIDFGIAVLAGQGDRSGTPAYMAPEQWRGEPAVPATDVYAATCVFFECLTGRRPFVGDSTEALQEAHLHAPPPVEEAPEAVRSLLSRGMAKSAEERPGEAAEFVQELEEAATAAYGPDWETRAVQALAGAAAALASFFPLAALLHSAGGAGGGAVSAGGVAASGGAASGGATGGAAASGGGAGGAAVSGGTAGGTAASGAGSSGAVTSGAASSGSAGGTAASSGTSGAGASAATGHASSAAGAHAAGSAGEAAAAGGAGGTATGGGAGGAAVSGGATAAAGAGGAKVGAGVVIAAGAVGVALVAGGGVAVVSALPRDGASARPTATSSARPVAAALVDQREMLNGQRVEVRAKYARLTGPADPAVRQRVDQALRAPLDWTIQRSQASSEESRVACTPSALVSMRASIGVNGPTLISVKYSNSSELYDDSSGRCLRLDGKLPGGAVTVDLKTGRAYTAEDILKPETLTGPGISTLWSRTTVKSQWSYWGPEGCTDEHPVRSDFFPKRSVMAGHRGYPALDPPLITVFLGPDHLEVITDGEGSDCPVETRAAPYAKVRDLLNPQIVGQLPA